MKIHKQEVLQVARLARLALSEEEAEAFTGQLDAILGYVEKLNELDTAGVAPTAHVVAMENVLREDRVESSLPRDQALANAPDARDGFFRVPRIL